MTLCRVLRSWASCHYRTALHLKGLACGAFWLIGAPEAHTDPVFRAPRPFAVVLLLQLWNARRAAFPHQGGRRRGFCRPCDDAERIAPALAMRSRSAGHKEVRGRRLRKRPARLPPEAA
jgi:hypothetical protein